MGAIRDTLLGYKHQKTENLLKTLEDKVLKNEASEKNSALIGKEKPFVWDTTMLDKSETDLN